MEEAILAMENDVGVRVASIPKRERRNKGVLWVIMGFTREWRRVGINRIGGQI